MKKLFLTFIVTLAAFSLSSAQALYEETEAHPAAPSVPAYVVFAGDTVRFDRPDFYERMDRELISFTYMHTNTTLMLKRSQRYFTIVEPILREQGVPEDFKYLMAIESNLDPKALSSAGAAGLWQIMKSTGQSHGLEANSEVDERYNVEKETVAACEYFKEAYGKFGDWITAARATMPVRTESRGALKASGRIRRSNSGCRRRPCATFSGSLRPRCSSRTLQLSVSI